MLLSMVMLVAVLPGFSRADEVIPANDTYNIYKIADDTDIIIFDAADGSEVGAARPDAEEPAIDGALLDNIDEAPEGSDSGEGTVTDEDVFFDDTPEPVESKGDIIHDLDDEDRSGKIDPDGKPGSDTQLTKSVPEEKKADGTIIDAGQTQRGVPAAAYTYTFTQDVVYLADILRAVGQEAPNNSALSVDNELITLSETTVRNKNLKSITLTAADYFDSAVLTVEKNKNSRFTVTLSYPDPSMEETDQTIGRDFNPSDYVELSGKMPKNAIVDIVPVTVEIDGETVLSAFDIKIYANEKQREKGKTWQPAGKKVTVRIRDDVFGAGEMNIYHISDDAQPQFIAEVTAEDNWVQFEAESFSVYAVTETILTKTITTSDGETYEFRVTYKNTSGIPMSGTELLVTELLPGDEGYDEYVERSAAEAGVTAEKIEFSRIFDITIASESDHDTIYEPSGDVDVSITLVGSSLDAYTNVDVLHFVEDEEADDFAVYDMHGSVEGETVSFTTDSFSVYVVAGYTLEKVITASDGNTYKVTVTYGQDANLPEDVDLSVTEVADDAAEFELYLNQAAARLEKDADDFSYARFFDISLISKNDAAVHYQPDTMVDVSIELLGADEEIMDTLQVLHIGSELIDIMDTTVDGTALNFKTDSFSIYPILDGNGENARIAYRFWYYNTPNRQYEEIGTQFFRYKDVQTAISNGSHCIRDPGIPGIDSEDMVTVFKGWYLGSFTGSTPAIDEEPTSIEALNTELEHKTSDQFIEGTYIDIFAELNNAYYITYVDVNTEAVRGTDLVLQAESGSTFFTVRSDVTVTRYQDNLKGWRLLEELTDNTATLYEAGRDYTISNNITLAPVIEGGYWLVFNDNDPVDDGNGNMISGGASYTPPAFYLNNSSEQQSTVRPVMNPEWVGYSFEGWYVDAAGTEEYTFGNVLTEDTTVYAKWTPAENFYTVIVWKQRANDAVDAADADKKYDFVSSAVINTKANDDPVKTGDYIILDPSYTTIYGAEGTSTDTDKSFYVYNQEKTTQYIVVKASGGSVFNIYYDRVPVTMNFYTWGNGYVYTETASDTGTQYGIVNDQYVPLTRVDGEEFTYTYTYSPAYNVTTNDTGTQYGVIDGEYRELRREGSYSYTYYAYQPTTGDTGTQYALVDGEYVRLTPNTRYYPASGYSYTQSTNDNDNDPAKYGINLTNNGGPARVYWARAGMGILTEYHWYSTNNPNYGSQQYTGSRFTRAEATSSNTEYTGTLFYVGTGNTHNFATTANGTAYGRSGSDGSYTYFPLRAETYWTYTDSNGDTVELSDTDTRYVQPQNNNNVVTYTGQRYNRSGTDWWSYSYTATDEQTTGLYGVDDRGGHVSLTRSNTANSYVYYDSTTGDRYNGTRYTVPNNNPVNYTGTLYTMPGGVPHVTTEDAVSGLYGPDTNGVYRELNGLATAQKLWTYVDPVTHETKYYTGTRYTRSNNQQNSWQLYRSYTGLYASTYGDNGYIWPADINGTSYSWYSTGYGTGGNAAATTQNRAGTAAGTRTTFTDAFILGGTKTSQNYYGVVDTANSRTVRFNKQNLDLTTYTEANRAYTSGSGTFSIVDKYEGFKPVAYSTNGGTTKTNLPATPDSSGNYATGISYNSTLDIYFDRKKNTLEFFPDPDTGAAPIDYSVPYGKSLEEYADQYPGEKPGHYFAGWYTDSARTVPFDFSRTMPDAGVAVYGYWRMERVRIIFVPGADNVYIDPGQAMSFRVDYNETVSGSMLEAATRPGYVLAGWYSDPEFNNKYTFGSPVNTNTTGVDKTYQTAARWAATRENYGDNAEKYENVRGVLVLYAKWTQDTEQSGVNIVYDAGAAALYDGMGYVSTTVPVDPRLYPDGSVVTVGVAPSNYSPLYVFDYWEIVDSDGNVVTVTNAQGAQIDHFEPGFTFNIDWVSDDDAYELTYVEGTDQLLIKTIRLRAHYTKNSDAAEYFTTITYDGDTFDQGMYSGNTDILQGRARDGSQRVTITLDKELNETIVLPNTDDFYLDGYTLVGWSLFEGSYTQQVAAGNAWNTENPGNPVYVQTVDLDGDNIEETTIHFAPAQRVAADNLYQSDPNSEANTLYAMWMPKNYTVTVRQVVEDGVAAAHGNSSQFTYSYKSGVENNLPSGTQSLTLDGTASRVFTTLSNDASTRFFYYDLEGHVFKITGPTIPDTAEYAVRVSATVLRDDGTTETLPLNALGNYQIMGDVTITYTYSLKVPVKLEKLDLANNSPLTGSQFTLTPIEWDSVNMVWKTVGSTVWTYDLTSTNNQTIRLQEGVYRVDEIRAPTDYAAMSEPLRLTVVKNGAFSLVTTTGAPVSENIAKLTGSDSHTLTIYDRPIREITIKKVVDGTDVTTNGKYTFLVQLSLEGSELKGYDTVGSGNAADTTDNSGVIEFTLGDNETKTLRIPWGSEITVSENEYAQFSVSTASQHNVADTETETARIYRCTVDVNDTITFTNTNRLLTVTKTVTGPWGDRQKDFAFTISGLTAGKRYYFKIGNSNQSTFALADGTVSFILKHGQTMTIALPDGTYAVSEDTEEYYTTTISTNGGTAVEALQQEITLSSGQTSASVEFINYRPATAPTGIGFHTLPFLIMLFAGLLLVCGMTMPFRPKKKERQD